MAGNPWFRMYFEFANDPKVQSMSESLQRRLIMLLCFRCSEDLVTFEEQDIAFAMRITDDDLADTKAVFLRKGFIDGDWNLLNWDKRQFVSDSSTERTRTYRERRRTSHVTAVTEVKRHSDGTESDTESDTESEESESQNAPAPARVALEIIRSIQPAPEPKPRSAIPETSEDQIRALADQAPDQQDYESGVNCAIQELLSSLNPAVTLQAMKDNLPLWWSAMREGRARPKPMRFVIADRDYLRRPREPTQSKRDEIRAQLSRQPNPRLQPRPNA